MPDSNGFPIPSEVGTKLLLTASDVVTGFIAQEVAPVLAAVVSEFQSPPVRTGEGGGTGRQFSQSVETRFYDGSGLPELVIDDVIPSLPLFASCYGNLLSGVTVRTPTSPGDGFHTLAFPLSGNYFSAGYNFYGFPRGLQNIAVTATFGSEVTADIWEALRCEAAYRILVQSFVGLTGVGEEVKIGDYSINTSVGAINFRLTSPLTVFHDKYLAAVSRYRRSPQREWSRMAARRQMS
jgi:hypothetical protein